MMGIPSNLNPIPFEPGEDSGTWAEQQPLVAEDPEAEMGALHGQSPAPLTVLPPSRQVAHVETEPSGTTSTYDPRRLHSEVENLRREMERLRTHTEGLVIGAPPSYTEGDG